ncbi:hypothetical protein J3458_019982 [Metarhizium acridum]|uniref:uncharacterized protein n=1 Tax=Metarhizium acridum TaxID=92637 RepID=UPI001C6B3DCB|nr:hypothetical protein J3458_019982 [Metarhizium acridum]
MQGVLLTLPYAWLADRTNKKALLFIGLVMSAMSMVAFFAICHFAKTASALDSVIFFRVFECVGGGVPMAYVLLNSLLFFRMTAEKRASVFYMMSMVLVVARAGGTALCGVLLDKYPRSAVPVAALVYGINLPLVAFFRTPQAASRPEGMGEPRPDGSPLLPDVHGEQRAKDGSRVADDIYARLASTCRELRKQPVLSWSLLFYVVKVLAIDVQMIQAQWAVARFNWTFSVVAYLNAYTAVVCFLILSGLPFASQLLVSRCGSPHGM